MTAYYLNPDVILSNPDVSATTKAAMRRSMKQAFVLPGHWVRDLSDIEIDQLCEILELSKIEDDANLPGPAGEELILLTMILATAEGCAPETDADVCLYSGRLAAFIICESLARKGMVKVFHDQMSFVEPDAIIVKRIDE